MTPFGLKIWIADRGISKRAVARELDISQNRLERFLNGDSRIPRHIDLACYALEHCVDLTPTTEKNDGLE
jgi:hypothetical protein